ncbi:MAG: class I SAM-dependent methyltransferase [Desulfobacteraceae bacterium]|nr:class I SAM-dependent methyltransferase [Desulfobacteraceae bacterium]
MTINTFLQNVRNSFNARMLDLADGMMDRIYGSRKREIFSRLPSTVVEIGPGAGANLRYYAPGTKVIAIEPNPAVHPHLAARAGRNRVDLEIKPIKGEKIDLPDNSVEAVVGSLVLCSVQDPRQVMVEVHRILKPGGRYIFVEHVAALTGTRLRWVQERLLSFWRRVFEGCHLNRNTHETIQHAGFSRVDMNCFGLSRRWLPFAPHIFGRAVK